jgi:hypothetical protein
MTFDTPFIVYFIQKAILQMCIERVYHIPLIAFDPSSIFWLLWEILAVNQTCETIMFKRKQSIDTDLLS